jgi:hypothetical protein
LAAAHNGIIGTLTPKPIQAPVFAALVRTTGARNSLLLEALESIALQSLPCLAIVIVHGSEESFKSVCGVCKSVTVRVLHASNADSRRRRGYPINVGIDYCLNELADVQYLFLLDDDDIVYPFFTRMMTAAFDATEADVIYSSANYCEAGKLGRAYRLKPYYHLFDRNFIPSNSYAIRVEALRQSGVRMDEDLDSLEDWLFLLRLLEHGCRFSPLDITLSEFRSDSAVESAHRYDLESWRASAVRVRSYINQTRFQIPGGDLALLAEKDARAPVDPQEVRFANSSTAAALQRRIWELEHSLSWKFTAPLRSVAGTLLRLKGQWKAGGNER